MSNINKANLHVECIINNKKPYTCLHNLYMFFGVHVECTSTFYSNILIIKMYLKKR